MLDFLICNPFKFLSCSSDQQCAHFNSQEGRGQYDLQIESHEEILSSASFLKINEKNKNKKAKGLATRNTTGIYSTQATPQ